MTDPSLGALRFIAERSHKWDYFSYPVTLILLARSPAVAYPFSGGVCALFVFSGWRALWPTVSFFFSFSVLFH